MSAPSRNISYNKPKEPTFLKAFKQRVGYKEPEVTVQSKRQVSKPGPDDDEREDREDELPTVVAMREGDVNQEEYTEFLHKKREEKTADTAFTTGGMAHAGDDKVSAESDGKIVFKRPVKRKSSESGAIQGSTSKRTKDDSEKPKKYSSKSVRNTSLLSFGEDED